MLNKPGTFLSAHALALYNWLKSPQGLDEATGAQTEVLLETTARRDKQLRALLTRIEAHAASSETEHGGTYQ